MSAEKTLFARVMPLVRENELLPVGGIVICAVSGGVDSVSLLHFLHTQKDRLGFELRACHMNHGIRDEAGGDVAFVERLCAAMQIPLYVKTVDVPAYAGENDLGLEEAGRILRYAWFEELCAKEDRKTVVATAHNADDNAETLLMHLVRGSGLNGLGGIPARRGCVVRPLLRVPRTEIERYAQINALEIREDRTNADTVYMRNYLRHKVMPLLKALNPSLTDTFTSEAEILRDDEEYLRAETEKQLSMICIEEQCAFVDVDRLCHLPKPIALRLIQRMAELIGCESVLSAEQRRSILQIAGGKDPGAQVSLYGTLRAVREYGRLKLTREVSAENVSAMLITECGSYTWGSWRIIAETAVMPDNAARMAWEYYLPARFPLQFRSRKSGDALRRWPREGTKIIKKWMIDAKIPKAERDRIPVVEQGGQVIAVGGFGMDWDRRPESGMPCLHLIIKGEGK